MDDEMLIPAKDSVCRRILKMLQENFSKVILFGCMTVLFATVILVSTVLSRSSVKRSSGSAAFYKEFNRSNDPCNDFYSYCCDTWLQNQTLGDEILKTHFSILQEEVNKELFDISENLTDTSHLPSIVQSALQFYNSCVNPVKPTENNLQPLLTFFSCIGGWPVLNNTVLCRDNFSWSEADDNDGFNWTKAVAKTIKVLGVQTLIGFYVAADDKNTSQNIIILGPPVLNNEALSSPSASAIWMVYMIIQTLNFAPMPYNEFNKHFDEVNKFEKALRNLVKPVDKLRISIGSTRMSIGELQHEIPQVNWLYFIQSIVNSSLKENVINDKYEVLIHNMNSLKSMITLIEGSSFSQRTIANYICAVIAEEMYIVISDVFENYANLYGMSVTEVTQKRKQMCFEKMSSHFPLALDYLYVQNNLDFDREKSSELIHYLKMAFRNLTMEAEWLDNETKLAALHKLNLLKEVIGYSATLHNASTLGEIFKKFPAMSSNALKNYFLISEFSSKKEIKKLGSVNLRDKLLPPRSVSDVGAYYILNWNTLVYPLAMHNRPFFLKNGPWYLNFGAVGSIIAHEITHAFDTLGHERDGYGNCHNWWTNSSLLEYKKRAHCFEKQFNKYKINGTNKYVNGTRTLGENIADSGGLRQAYVAYQLWKVENGIENPLPGFEDYTPEQLFFTSFGSIWCTKISPGIELGFYRNTVHSPPKVRVSGSVSNSKDFADAFNCSKGAPMNPVEKCMLW